MLLSNLLLPSCATTVVDDDDEVFCCCVCRCSSLLLLLYLPVRTPPPNGDQAVTPMFNASAIGSNSRSAVLSIRLYSICKPVNSVHPLRFARVLTWETIQAGASETPMYKILPDLTISSRARIISSIGVRGSHA